jgi:hypothetical protein
MGFFSKIKDAVTSGISEIAKVATGGVIGKMIAGALERFGLPPEICGLMACIGDPSYSKKFLADELDRIGKKLGLPEQLTGALKKIIDKADEYALAFAKGGFGAVVKEVGKDLGLPPELYLAVAAGIDAYTGNAAGAAANLALLAGQCARRLGVPESAINIVEFAGAAASGDAQAMTQAGMKVVDGMDILPPELESLAMAGAGAAFGDEKAIQENLFKLGTEVGERIGLPKEVVGGLKLAVAYQMDDPKAIEGALREVGNDLVSRLPKELQGPLRMAVDKFAKDPKGAWEDVKNLPDSAQEAFATLTAAAKNPDTLKKVAALGIDQLPAELRGPVGDAVELYLKDPKAAMESLKNLPARGQQEFFALLDKATDPEALKTTAKNFLEKQVAGLAPDARKAYDVALHLATGNIEALKQDAKKFSDEEISKLPPSAQQAINTIKRIGDGDNQTLALELKRVGQQAVRDLAQQYAIPMRA